MKAVLGGKGANPAEMSNAGLPVPPGLIELLKHVLIILKLVELWFLKWRSS